VSHSRERILLSHGGGGRLTRELIEQELVSVLAPDEALAQLGDSALVPGVERLAFTTDSFVVKPIFFPGGDIGRLAVCGTVNDLAVAGAEPLYLSLAMVLEEGLPLDDLRRIVRSVRAAAEEARVRIICGDTKVVEHGSADQIFLTTSGAGRVPPGVNLSPRNVVAGDVVLLSGTLGDHSIAVMSAREGIEFGTDVISDVQPLNDLARALMSSAEVRWMRDPTRGGAAGVLNELVRSAGAAPGLLGVELDEMSIPVTDAVRGACNILGLDPLYAANEGKLIAVVSRETSAAALRTLRKHPRGAEASIIGRLAEAPRGRVIMRTAVGGRRIVDMPTGEQLPRIC
jgi:hydrogenase expression/formation protein HypE